jgi:hypothetical protein
VPILGIQSEGSLTWVYSEFAFQASGNEGAVLVMPDGALTEDLYKHKLRLVEKYIAENAKSWYEYAESDETENGDIRVVVGMDKVSSWGIATFKNVDLQEPLRFEFKNDGRVSQAATYRWDGILGGRAGPQEEEVRGLQGPNISPLRNQSVFVRTLNISVSGKVRPDELAVHEIRASSFRDCSPDHQVQPESQIGLTVSLSSSSNSRSAANFFFLFLICSCHIHRIC